MKPNFLLTAGLLICSSVNSQILINEVVTDPQSDWSSNDFNSAQPEGTITTTDEYVELYITESGLDLNLASIDLIDGTDIHGTLTEGSAFDHVNYISLKQGRFDSTAKGDIVLLGNPLGSGSMTNTVQLKLYYNGLLTDSIQLYGSILPSGNASSVADESLSRIPDGGDNWHQTSASPSRLNSPDGQVMINEWVTSPQSDWSASDFSAQLLHSSSGSNDEWVELLILDSNLNLLGWTIELLDGSDVVGDLTENGAFSSAHYHGQGLFSNTQVGDLLILGNVQGSGSMSNTGTLILKNAHGHIIDSISFGNEITPNGNGQNRYEEALQRFQSGDSVWYSRSIATPGQINSDQLEIWQIIDSQKGWHFITPVVENAQVSALKGDIPLSGFSGSDYPSMTFDNLQYYDGSMQQYIGADSLSQAMRAGEGWQAYLGIVPDTIKWVGRPVNPDFSFPLPTNSIEDQWLLMGNPFFDAIDWDAADFVREEMDDAFYIWNPEVGNYATYAYGIGLNGGTAEVPAGHAFWVKTNGSNPWMSITADALIEQSESRFKKGVTGNIVRVKQNGRQDEVFLTSQHLDNWIYKLPGDSLLPTIQIIAKSKSYAYASVGEDEVILRVSSPQYPATIEVKNAGDCLLEFEAPQDVSWLAINDSAYTLDAPNEVVDLSVKSSCGIVLERNDLKQTEMGFRLNNRLLTTIDQNQRISLYSLHGQLIWVSSLSETHDLSHLPSGAYFVQIGQAVARQPIVLR